jgi:acyl transferase domain-containing protein
MTIDTACSGSLTSVDLACRYLDSGDADGAIVAGCNMYLNPEHNMEQSAMNVAASRTGRCWTFDARADGYIKAEAINTIILKRLDDAIRDGDPIRAVIRGSSTNSDGWTPGIANPSSDAQVVAIKRAYERAGISNFADTAYLECHGTGTLAGDPIEVTAASAVFAPDRPSPLRIGSVKSNIGHSEPAAGISGMLKMILSIENSVIPGNPTFEFPNPNIDFARLNVLPSRVATSWPFENMKRGSVNSFGFGGSNAHVIVEHHNVLMPDFASPHVSSYLKNEADFFTFDEKENNSRRVFVFSANDDISLKALTQSYIRHLSNPAVRVKSVDLAYTLSERRSQLFHRAFAISRDHKFGNGQLVFGKPRSAPPRIGFVFTGQGAQWSQMGRELLGLFSVARTTVTRLDRALNDLLEPPPWSLYNELIQQRTAEHMRSPEFSQPLVTALQLALFDVVSDLGLRPVAVIGHSSGEIAAAAVSGHLTYEEAIKVAYLRGKLSTVNSERRLGMLAVGLSETDVYSYIQEAPHVKLACINSPESVTLAGEVADLEQVQEEIQASGHFTRHLQVDMAYHSDYMTGVAQEYLLALRWCCPGLGSQDTTSEVKFFSSVFGAKIHVRTDAQYWHDNMVRPVQFSRALESMVTKGGADTLVELGPSAALAGPISQTIESLQEHAIPVEYFATLSRGSDCMRPLYELMGKMFLAAVDINLMRLNNVGTTDQPRTIIDLPNYAWNHTTKYWHEPLSSIDWRFRKFPIHDLLGTKILGTSWQMPSWRRILRLRELPWLRDHRIGPNIIFPASGYIAMAVEAMFQTSVSLDLIEGANDVSDVAYGLRNVRLLRALVLEEDEDRHIYTFLHSTQNVQTSWYRFSIQSFRDGTWLEHADGLVQVRPSTEPELDTCDALASFQYPTNSGLWYKALDRVGLNFGPAFQNVIEYETCPGAETGRARLSWPREEDLTKQSAYTIHPTIIDAFFQAGCPAVFRYRTAIDRILVPKSIENITIPSRRVQPLSTIALTRCMYTGSGRRDSVQTRASHAEVYNEHNGQVVFKISGLLYNEMEPSQEFRKAHDYLRLSWMPDVNALHDAPLESLHFARDDIAALAIALDCSESAAGMVSLVQHKTGSLSLLDFDMRPEDQEKSNQPLHEPLATSRFSSYVCISTTASNLARSRARMRDQPRCSYLIYDIQDERQEPFESDLNFDMIVLRGPFNSVTQLDSLLMRAKYYATAGGFILLVLSNISAGELGSSPDGNVADISQCYERIISTLLSAGLEICLRSGSSEAASSAFLCSVKGPGQNQKQDLACSILGLSDKYVATQLQTLSESLRAENVYGTVVSIEEAINTPIQVPIILLDHTDSPLLESVDEQRWHELQTLLKSDRKILYVSSGSEEDVMLPGGSLFTGLARTLRSEDPSLMIKTLELSCISRSSAVSAISHVLNGFENASEHSEREYYEHRGLLYVSRLQRDTALIEADNQSTSSREVQKMWLHANTRMVRVRCSRIGTLDSLGYHEIDNRDNQLREDCIEIEIRAAALNFKDIATTMGLVVEDEYRLGSDGAGVVRQVGNKVKDFVVGDRVMFFCKGAFANRIQTEPERCLKISDTMSFEVSLWMCGDG